MKYILKKIFLFFHKRYFRIKFLLKHSTSFVEQNITHKGFSDFVEGSGEREGLA